MELNGTNCWNFYWFFWSVSPVSSVSSSTALVATPNARRIAVAAAAAGVARGGALSTRSPRQLGRDGALACLQGSDASAKVRDQLGEEGGRKEGGGRGLLGGERHGESRGPWPIVHK